LGQTIDKSIQNSIKTYVQFPTDIAPSPNYRDIGERYITPPPSAPSLYEQSLDIHNNEGYTQDNDNESLHISVNTEQVIIDVSSTEETDRNQSTAITTRPVLMTTQKYLDDDFQYRSVNIEEDSSAISEVVSIVRKNLSNIRQVNPRAVLQMTKGKVLWGFKSLMQLNPIRIASLFPTNNYTSSDQSR
jgi:hypothetical protein